MRDFFQNYNIFTNFPRKERSKLLRRKFEFVWVRFHPFMLENNSSSNELVASPVCFFTTKLSIYIKTTQTKEHTNRRTNKQTKEQTNCLKVAFVCLFWHSKFAKKWTPTLQITLTVKWIWKRLIMAKTLFLSFYIFLCEHKGLFVCWFVCVFICS